MIEEEVFFYEEVEEAFNKLSDDLLQKINEDNLGEFATFAGIVKIYTEKPEEERELFLRALENYPNENIKFFSSALLNEWDFVTVIRQVLNNIIKIYGKKS